MEVVHSTGVYEGFKIVNIKCLNFVNVLKKLTRDDTNPLFKGFKLAQFRQ